MTALLALTSWGLMQCVISSAAYPLTEINIKMLDEYHAVQMVDIELKWDLDVKNTSNIDWHFSFVHQQGQYYYYTVSYREMLQDIMDKQ